MTRLAAAISVCLVATAVAGQRTGDSAIQRAVDQATVGRTGTAVVLDVASGAVIGAYHLDIAARRAAYPGSSIKPFTLTALLESGKVDSQTALLCRRPLDIAGHRLDCSHPDTHQPLDPATALAYSCNSYFTTVATRLTPGELHEALVRDGFTSPTGLSPHEASGTVEMASSREQLQLQAIGDWGLRVTPLELLRAYRNLALLARSRSDPKLAPLFAGLEGSTSYGMARLAQPRGEVRVSGKTGTANSDESQWTHAWFAGFAPADNPEIVLVVFLEKGRGSDAAEVASKIFAVLGNGKRTTAAAAGSNR